MLHAANIEDRKLTRNQTLVLSVLEEAEQPLSAYRILDRLNASGLKAPLQVYRALDKLVEAGRVHRVESLNAFMICCHAGQGHLHPAVTVFEICESCGKVTEFHDEKAERTLSRHARGHGFKARSTTVEIRGLCSACCAQGCA